jgi:uncharacterized protein YeaO (DUF488 family)
MITVRRVYDKKETWEKYRVLVDRFWPRGISKTDAGWDEWLKEVSPGNELRKWYSHDHSKWEEFKQRYKKELDSRQGELRRLRQLELEHGNLTLLYSSKEREYNNAVALREFIMQQYD